MRTFISAITIFILLNGSLWTQSTIGIEGGFNLANVKASMDKGNDTKMLPGFNAGINFEIEMDNTAYIYTGLFYSKKGNTSKNDVVELSQNMYYLEIPLMLVLKIKGKTVTPAFGAGIYIGKLLSSSHIEKYKTGEVYEYDSKEEFDAGDFGFITDAGVNIRLTKSMQLHAGAAYYFGTKNVLIEELHWIGSVKNTGPRFNTGVKFDL